MYALAGVGIIVVGSIGYALGSGHGTDVIGVLGSVAGVCGAAYGFLYMAVSSSGGVRPTYDEQREKRALRRGLITMASSLTLGSVYWIARLHSHKAASMIALVAYTAFVGGLFVGHGALDIRPRNVIPLCMGFFLGFLYYGLHSWEVM